MTITWEEIEDSIEDSRRSENDQQFYNFVKSIIEENQLTCIDKILKLSLILIGLPYENRYEIFNLPNIQIILNNFNAKEIVELYGLFLPEDAYKFFRSDYIQFLLRKIPPSDIDCEDIISYIPDENGMRDSVRGIFNTLIQLKEPNNISTAQAKRIQYSRLTQEDLLGNPQFFNRLPEPYNNQNISSDDEGYSSASEASQNRNRIN